MLKLSIIAELSRSFRAPFIPVTTLLHFFGQRLPFNHKALKSLFGNNIRTRQLLNQSDRVDSHFTQRSEVIEGPT